MPRTKRPELEIKGKIPQWMISRLQKDYGKNLEITSDDNEELVDVFETDWFKKMYKKSSPGENMRIYRENMGITQIELGEKLGNTQDRIFLPWKKTEEE
jgi:hypothetical protein